MGLNESEYALICELMGREPSLTELGMFAVMWSEHCGYKYSRPILRYFSTYRQAVDGSGLENAGVVPIGNGLGIAMKVESHNHPSAVEPYQGAATGVGGIIRDIFTMGARPIAMLNSLRFGPIKDGEAADETVARNRYLLEHVVEGIAGYGNCVGVPTVAGEVAFHPRYSGNPLVNAMCVGIVHEDDVTTAGAEGIGNSVLYLGSATGKDGIHGATFASEELSEDNEAKRPNVQIGDPFAEKALIEATLEALQTGAIVAIQDMGAAGLTCSTTEMAAKGRVGMTVDLDKVPMRESDMTGYELMLSESQERMLAIVHQGREAEVLSVFAKWGLPAAVIGEVSPEREVVVMRHGVVEARVDPLHLTDHCPTYHVEPVEPARYQEDSDWEFEAQNRNLAGDLLALLARPTLTSKRWITRQYDHQVQTQTVVLPGEGDAAVLAPRGCDQKIAVAIDGNSRWTAQDPYVGGLLAVCESARNVACVGAKPVAVTDGLNFGNPQDPEIFWEFERAVRGLADATEALNLPVVSGNVSFYNESEGRAIPPTPMIGMLGVIPANCKPLRMVPEHGTWIVAVIGAEYDAGPQQGIGASAWLGELRREEKGVPINPSLEAEGALTQLLVQANLLELLGSAHDVSEGGLAFALAEMAALRPDLSWFTRVPDQWQPSLEDPVARCFGEIPTQVIVTVRPENYERLAEVIPDILNIEVLGACEPGSDFVLQGPIGQEWIALKTSQIADRYLNGLQHILHPDEG